MIFLDVSVVHRHYYYTAQQCTALIQSEVLTALLSTKQPRQGGTTRQMLMLSFSSKYSDAKTYVVVIPSYETNTETLVLCWGDSGGQR